jgi:hypothetical protein
MQAIRASDTEPEEQIASLEHLAQQPDQHELDGSDLSTDSFVSAQEGNGSDGTHSGDEKPHNGALADPASVAQGDTSERPALSPSSLQGEEEPTNAVPASLEPAASNTANESPTPRPTFLFGEGETHDDAPVVSEPAVEKTTNESTAPSASSLPDKIPWIKKVVQLEISMHEIDRLRRLESAQFKHTANREKILRLDNEIALRNDNIALVDDSMQRLERGMERERKNVQVLENNLIAIQRLENAVELERGHSRRLESEVISEREKSQSLENEVGLERGNSRRLENTITSEREKSQRLKSEITLERNKVRDSESSTREIALDRDKLRGELEVSRRQLEAARRNSATLERQARDLHFKRCEGNKGLKRQVADLTAKMRDHESGYAQTYRNGVQEGMRSLPFAHLNGVIDERVVLLQQVEAYKAEAAKWRMDAFRQGSETVSRCWQASVDEAVRREREKDVFVMEVLRDEIAVLKSKKEG